MVLTKIAKMDGKVTEVMISNSRQIEGVKIGF
jgi:hypothetical protein